MRKQDSTSIRVTPPSPRWLTETGTSSDRKKRANVNESRVAGLLGGRRTRNSGGHAWAKDRRDTEARDGETPDLVFEHKSIDSDTKSMALKREWLEQIVASARRSMKDPALVLTFTGATQPDWVAVPLEVARRLMGIDVDG